MANYLAAVQNLLAEKLLQMQVAASLKDSVPSDPEIEDLKLPEGEPEGNETTKNRKRVKAEIKEDAKKKLEENKKEAKEKVNAAKEDLKKKVNDAAKDNAHKVQEILMDIVELGMALGELLITCIGLPVRLALVPASIIGSCPLGPTVQPTQAVMTIKQLKEIGDDLGTKYSKCQAAWNKLGADQLIEGAKSNPLIAMIPGFAASLTPVTTAFTLINTCLTTVKPMITMVGGGVCSVSGPKAASISTLSLLPPIQTYADGGDEWPGPFGIEGEDEQGEEPEVDIPDGIEYEAEADECFNFRAIDDERGESAENCSNFSVINKKKYERKNSKGETEYYYTKECNNCSKYKPFHKQLTIRLRENTKEIFGSSDLWLKADTFNPLAGSLKYRMKAVEDRCTALENRCTVLENRCIELENRCTVLEGKVDDNVGWDVEAGWDRDQKMIWVDLKNSKGSILNRNEVTTHTAAFSIADFHDTRVKTVQRINLWKYDSIYSQDLKDEINTLMGWIEEEDIEHDSIWGLLADDDTTIVYKPEEIPEDDRIDGNTYAVFVFENSFGDEVNPLWINVSLLSVKYNFSTNMDLYTKNYFDFTWSKILSGHSTLVTANFKYRPYISGIVPEAENLANGVNDIMSNISSANGEGKINNINK